MTKFKVFDVDHEPTGGMIRVEIDDTVIYDAGDYGKKTVDDAMREMVLFWSDSKRRLRDNNDNVLDAFLKMLCQIALVIAQDRNYNHEGVIKALKGEEGWYPLDGSAGIKLIKVELMELDEQKDYTIFKHADETVQRITE